jgi:hypothetical protein
MKEPHQRLVVATVHLREATYKALRLEAARRGTSIQKALEQAIETWLRTAPERIRKPLAGLRLRGMLRNTKVMEIREEERRTELARDRQRL